VIDLGPLPLGRAMFTRDERHVRAKTRTIFAVVRDVEHWPAHLAHYHRVRFRERWAGGGVVEMAAWRPFGWLQWPTWWVAQMQEIESRPAVRFRHIEGITRGMEVEWVFEPRADGTWVRVLHAWDGPRWPLVGVVAATTVIGPVFVHGIASRTLAGLARVAEREAPR